VEVFRGPHLCGRSLGTIPAQGIGYPFDAAALDAANGKILVALAPPFSLSGGVETCTLAQPNSCVMLQTPQTYGCYSCGAFSVAMDHTGDCWATLETTSGFILDYFRACTGKGIQAAGWVNAGAGGLDIDAKGDLVSISSTGSDDTMYIYVGCKPLCYRVGGPFALHSWDAYGHLNRENTLFAAGGKDEVDVFSYSPRSLQYLYSFKNGIPGSDGAAFSPHL
jgi:hypothetical protein